MGLLAVLSPALAGGRLRRLAEVRFRHTWVVLVALAAQVVAISVLPEANHTVLSGVHLATYVAAGAFVWLNRTIPGLSGGRRGCRQQRRHHRAQRRHAACLAVGAGAGRAAPHAGEFLNSGVLEHPRLGFLGDVFAIPAGLPLSNVFSVGDVVIVLGVAWGAHRICGSRLVPAWTPASCRPRARAAPASDWSPRVGGPSTVLPSEGGPATS